MIEYRSLQVSACYLFCQQVSELNGKVVSISVTAAGGVEWEESDLSGKGCLTMLYIMLSLADCWSCCYSCHFAGNGLLLPQLG